jgi:hypothetical protein
MAITTLNRDPDRHHNGEVDNDVNKDLERLAALAKNVRKHEAAAEKDRTAIRELLPSVRAKGVGPADLERAIQSVFVAGTISRWTKDVAVPRGKARPGG